MQPGVLWGELDAATQEHGLAVTGGRGVVDRVAGFALGSGSGWLERKMGLAADNLRAARVLTADGHVVTASADENPDLFWALRGGGGNFGIVVEFEFALRPVGPIILGGMLIWPRERAAEVTRAYRDLMAEAPDALCGGLALMSAPPLLPSRPSCAAAPRSASWCSTTAMPSAAPSTSRRCVRSTRRSTPCSRCPTARCRRCSIRRASRTTRGPTTASASSTS